MVDQRKPRNDFPRGTTHWPLHRHFLLDGQVCGHSHRDSAQLAAVTMEYVARCTPRTVTSLVGQGFRWTNPLASTERIINLLQLQLGRISYAGRPPIQAEL